uniref:Uncharacterized protein n=1 Tax=Chromera velia CCMP2878 TaxID=1169474 RepID=A0A0G4I0U5_9ALVE|eukprot:Cvel_10009.t1-p1 / transcript=Cvel_10009.t1 / gene=Cvel_10009 / organism=Chromera_velia_CCMP2878 / gene_product=hypothetical protein / transcript_product=hypothetical protein / location=Cvel_scaffold593:51163-56345(-) / protein_length=614 / sequence_SO=supercontig / SO=protein_coding / is_pseudo=false
MDPSSVSPVFRAAGGRQAPTPVFQSLPSHQVPPAPTGPPPQQIRMSSNLVSMPQMQDPNRSAPLTPRQRLLAQQQQHPQAVSASMPFYQTATAFPNQPTPAALYGSNPMVMQSQQGQQTPHFPSQTYQPTGNVMQQQYGSGTRLVPAAAALTLQQQVGAQSMSFGSAAYPQYSQYGVFPQTATPVSSHVVPQAPTAEKDKAPTPPQGVPSPSASAPIQVADPKPGDPIAIKPPPVSASVGPVPESGKEETDAKKKEKEAPAPTQARGVAASAPLRTIAVPTRPMGVTASAPLPTTMPAASFQGGAAAAAGGDAGGPSEEPPPPPSVVLPGYSVGYSMHERMKGLPQGPGASKWSSVSKQVDQYRHEVQYVVKEVRKPVIVYQDRLVDIPVVKVIDRLVPVHKTETVVKDVFKDVTETVTREVKKVVPRIKTRVEYETEVIYVDRPIEVPRQKVVVREVPKVEVVEVPVQRTQTVPMPLEERQVIVEKPVPKKMVVHVPNVIRKEVEVPFERVIEKPVPVVHQRFHEYERLIQVPKPIIKDVPVPYRIEDAAAERLPVFADDYWTHMHPASPEANRIEVVPDMLPEGGGEGGVPVSVYPEAPAGGGQRLEVQTPN